LYIDRVCFSTLIEPLRTDLQLSDSQRNFALGVFFITYALFQVPVGLLADRYGPRRVLTAAITAWSLVTLSTGFVGGFIGLLLVRLLLGVTEAGAYPAAGGLIKAWTQPQQRGRFSSLVTLGGRIGGAIAPWLTVTTVALLSVAGWQLGWFPNPSGQPWRGVFVVYGLCGLAVALLFWLIVRDQPMMTPPATDQAASGASSTTSQSAYLHLLLAGFAACFRSSNMLLFGLMQFGVNLGWGFLITLMPSYLQEQFQVPLHQQGQMQSTALFIGCCGMFFGGFLTDACRDWFGPVWGRRIPLIVAIMGCSLMLLSIPVWSEPWVVVAALGLMAFLVDLHNPVIWAFAQDVGGKNVGVALGFGNMCGNLGAALSPIVLGTVRQLVDWNTAFLVGASAFAVAAGCSLLLNASRSLEVHPRGGSAA
jgi:sugar phosphate permease